MAKKVLKFGGTSVGSIKRILHAAKIIAFYDNGNKLIVVVSAMVVQQIIYLNIQNQYQKNLIKENLDVLIDIWRASDKCTNCWSFK